MDYLLLKYIHIVSSTIVFGTGIGSAFYMFMANQRKDVANIYFATRHVVIADWLFTTPAVLVQLISGIFLVKNAGYAFADLWLLLGVSLYLFAVTCWIPVVVMQIKMRDLAKAALKQKQDLPQEYWQMNKWWIILGSLAFPAIIIVFYLMVFKPV